MVLPSAPKVCFGLLCVDISSSVLVRCIIVYSARGFYLVLRLDRLARTQHELRFVVTASVAVSAQLASNFGVLVKDVRAPSHP